MGKSKSAALASVLVFASGALVGVVGARLYTVQTVANTRDVPAPPKRRSPEEFRRRYVADLSEAVKLDDQQIAQLNKILDATRDEFMRLHDKFNADAKAIGQHQLDQITAMLRPDQRKLFDEFHAKREAERKRRQAERDKQK